MVGDERLKVFPVGLQHVALYLHPGHVQVHGDDVIVGTGSHAITLGNVQQAGRGIVSASEWIRNNSDAVLQ